eukprot:TRINITY_DN39935_c2_g1_i1.p3 TRINITY_DN39935_c2_g1~~TRINITY_DN39935_c2_g1_i1.p3  ORF type:complete len:159 (-),score=6.79 TRINITY_DN39935_c2_g1_i1:217-693(-)
MKIVFQQKYLACNSPMRLAFAPSQKYKISGRKLVKTMAYNVELKTPEGRKYTVSCNEDDFILDAALEQGVPVPYCCKKGLCTTCLARVESGMTVSGRASVNVSKNLQERGYMLMCSFKPTSDCVLNTHRNNDLNQIEYAYTTSIDSEAFDYKLQEMGL